ncbi:Transcriptional regulator, GntR family / Transcriptional regulator, LacI family protein [Lentisphaera araneosa HTCC2155]|jgi:GntR family transcriptional regulator, arabinose operon transcriptional repressor|uniref:Transcriptional regulator, GntR family / Transcriptional regulator, LacI family protein n=1 Tax=Lentisphaera araneosa HTCC2155 TaxID=313628 RepID=A6DJT2_9BACT|nr:substrate-binding domain-containing protein [Lentisphaera araneosa]EDM28156.1 Transcriptional regulator, GntR family / Transcriptional regulator, LacI family protein [Lentisphaera araneosa HTCC2155]
MKSRKNKTQEIYEFLKKEIEAGTYEMGELLPTDLQISEKFSTSRPTVAKAVQRLVEENVLGRKAGFGTYLKNKPQTAGSNEQITLGLLIPSLGETEIFEPICAQIASLADSHNFNLLWGNAGSSLNNSTAVAEKLAYKYVQEEVDGVFFTPLELHDDSDEVNARILELFKKAHIPVILLDRDVAKAPLKSEYDLIGINNVEAGFLIGSHLIERKCQSIAFITRPNIASTVHMRLMGLREAILQAKLSHDSVEEIMVDDDIAELAKIIAPKDFDALAVYNDAAAAELSMALNDLGINIPDDIKICSFDDVKYAKLLKTPLTTYRQPCRDIGSTAVEIMMSRIQNPGMTARKVLLHGELIIRESSK